MIDRDELTKVANDYYRPLGLFARVAMPREGDAPHEEGDVWLDVVALCEGAGPIAPVNIVTNLLVKKDDTMEQVASKFPSLIADMLKASMKKSLILYETRGQVAAEA